MRHEYPHHHRQRIRNRVVARTQHRTPSHIQNKTGTTLCNHSPTHTRYNNGKRDHREPTVPTCAASLPDAAPILLQPGDTLYTRTFVIELVSSEEPTIHSRLHDNILHIALSATADHNDPHIQEAPGPRHTPIPEKSRRGISSTTS